MRKNEKRNGKALLPIVCLLYTSDVYKRQQIAYAVARILKLPWTTLDMSSINDSKQLTGSPRIYANAKPGIIMEAFSMAGALSLIHISVFLAQTRKMVVFSKAKTM